MHIQFKRRTQTTTATETTAMTKAYSNYIVTVRVQFPAWNEREGLQFFVRASSKAEAIKEARRENRTGGQVHSEQGRAVWSAELGGDGGSSNWEA